MNGLFRFARSFNANLHWITDSVNDMAHMFEGCISFQGDVSRFNTSRVQQMRNMFNGCSNFNSPIRSNGFSWQVGSVLNMTGMFDGATNFNQNIRDWNTNSVTDMSFMFRNARLFNHPIDLWNTSNVTNMQSMFQGATSFNQNINTTPILGGWNTSRVTNMERMFDGAASFNNGQSNPIVGFNGFLSQQESNANSFWNGQLVLTRTPNPRQTMNWNTTSVTNINFMFNGARNFVNVDISRWFIALHIARNTLSFRGGNISLSDTFTPLNIWFVAPNRGR
jgi:surface protein